MKTSNTLLAVAGVFLWSISTAAAYDAYDYYPGLTCNGLFASTSSGVAAPPANDPPRWYGCPIIRIYPRTSGRLYEVRLDVNLNIPGGSAAQPAKVCAKQHNASPVCVTQFLLPGRHYNQVRFTKAELRRLRDLAFGWDQQLYVVVPMGRGDWITGYVVLWENTRGS